jgi:excisionase family DNA binding protein
MSKAETSTTGQGGGDAVLASLAAFVRGVAIETFREMSAPPPASDGDDRGITAREAAALLGVQPWRVYELIRRKELPAYHVSRQRLRLRLGAVREYMRRQKP